jgi:NAD(P)H-flavin reductase/hemoglobin-like flavoprotein
MDAAALQRSWDKVTAAGDEGPLFFYSHLFLSHPDVRSMFPLSMSGQRDKFVSALGRIVSNAHQIEDEVAFLEHLGRDHRKYEVVAEHYNAVGASFFAMLKHFNGAEWDEDLAGDWAEAYALIARVMVQAAEGSSEKNPDWWDAEVISVERRMMDVTLLQVRPTTEYDFKPGQSFSMEIPQRPRMWRYFSPANAPRDDGTIDLHVQMIDGGQVSTPLVRQIKIGDKVRLGAPVGDRLIRTQRDQTSLLMVAGGTGLAPLRAVLEQIDREWIEHGQAPRVHLLRGVRLPWHLYDRPLLRELAKSRPWFEYTEVISDDPSYPGLKGQVGTVAARQHLDGRIALLCGGPQMIAHTLEELTAAGMPTESIKYEHFYYTAASELTADSSANGAASSSANGAVSGAFTMSGEYE